MNRLLATTILFVIIILSPHHAAAAEVSFDMALSFAREAVFTSIQ